MIVVVAGAFAADWTLQGALDRALEENLELAQQRHGNAIVRYRLTLARAAFDPRLTASASTSRSKTPSNQATDVTADGAVVTSGGASWNVGLGSSLPSGGSVSASVGEYLSTTDSANALSDTFVSTSARVGISQPLLRGFGFGNLSPLRDAHLELAAQEIRWRARVEETVLEVARAYWGVVSAREGRAIALRGVELAEQQLAETLEREEAGFAGSGDVLQVRVSLGQARRGAVDADATVGAAEQRLARLVGLPLEGGAELVLTDRPEVPDALPDREGLLAEAEAGNAVLALARVDLERSRRSARRARNEALPDLDLNASAGWSAGGTDPAAVRRSLVENPAPSAQLGISLGLPLVPRTAVARIGIAGLQLDQAELAFEAAEMDLVLAVDAALRTLRRDAGGLEAARQTLEHARASLDAQQELLDEGRGSTRDVVDALESLRSAELAELDALIALQGSLLEARRVGGTLVRAEQL